VRHGVRQFQKRDTFRAQPFPYPRHMNTPHKSISRP
jgi:hypothetical protein